MALELCRPLAVRKKSTVTPPEFSLVQETLVRAPPRYTKRKDREISDGGTSSSLSGANRRSEIPDAVPIFRAVDSQSLEALIYLLNNRPELANCHGGSFHVTPLHCAVENNWTEGVQQLLSSGASVTSRNQYGQTPLHYAAARGRTKMLSTLLTEGSSVMIDTQDLRGVTALHDAATVGCLKAVEVLMKHGADSSMTDSTGQTPLHKATKTGALECAAALMKAGADLLQKDERGVTPKRYLREHPESLETLLDTGIHTSANRQSGFPLTFDFALLVAPYKIQQCRLLENFAKSDCSYLLAHPLCHILLLIKWRKTRIIFFIYLLFFILFSALTYTLVFDRFVWSNCQRSKDVSNNSTNATFTKSIFSRKNSKKCETIDDIFPVKVTMLIQMAIISIGQINRLRNQAISCLKSLTWWLLLSILVLCTIIITESWIRPTDPAWWEHHVATLIIMLQGTQILHLISKFPSLGIYWLMFIRVAEMFLRVFFIYLCLLVTFTMTFYLALAEKESDEIFGNIFLTFLKSLTMMVGELDLQEMKKSLSRLPVTSHILLVLFILLISIIMANLLVALAVSDVNGLRSIAHLMRLASMVEAIESIEQLWDCPVLKYLSQLCYLPTQDIQFRLWPRTDQRHPKIIVKLSDAAIKKPSLFRYSKDRSWFMFLVDKLRSTQYSVQISTCILENLLDRLDVKEGNSDSRLSVKFRCLGPPGAGRKISAAEMVSRRRHTLCKTGPPQRSAFSRRLRAPSRKRKKIYEAQNPSN